MRRRYPRHHDIARRRTSPQGRGGSQTSADRRRGDSGERRSLSHLHKLSCPGFLERDFAGRSLARSREQPRVEPLHILQRLPPPSSTPPRRRSRCGALLAQPSEHASEIEYPSSKTFAMRREMTDLSRSNRSAIWPSESQAVSPSKQTSMRHSPRQGLVEEIHLERLLDASLSAICATLGCCRRRARSPRPKQTSRCEGWDGHGSRGCRREAPAPQRLASPEVLVPRVGIEPTTRGFSVRCSTN